MNETIVLISIMLTLILINKDYFKLFNGSMSKRMIYVKSLFLMFWLWPSET